MFDRVKRLLLITLIVGVYSCNNKPAVQIPVADFFSTPLKNTFHISPDGKYVSYLTKYKGQQNVVIKTLVTGKERMATSFTDYPVRDYFWTYNNQIVIMQYLYEVKQFKLLAVDAQTLQMHTLLNEGKVNFKLLNRKTNNPDVITFYMNKRDSATIDVYRINTKSGELKMYLQNPGNITEWFPDADGKIRLAKASDGVNESILFRENDESKFKPIIVNNFKNRVEPVAFTGDKNYFYALSNVNRDKTALVEINAANIKEEKVIYDTPNADIEDIRYSINRHRLELVGWQEAKPQKHFFNEDVKSIYTDLAGKLPGNELRIVDRDSTEHNVIVSAYNDRNPGSYYLYSTAERKLTKLADLNAKINPDELCEMKPVSFHAGDGTLINGYLTLPKDKSAENLPLVVIPHSDPWRRNNWSYSADVQFLANRGYAVFQVNYRGSTGYGKAFYSSGFKQIGGKMQQDITDGVKWLIDQKIANPKKIAIFGTGFGGFSALYGASFHPGLYNCVVVQNGLINLFTYVKDVPPFFKPMLSMLYEMVGNPDTDADQFRAISPVFNADKIKAPLLIFQSAKDAHANISELNQFVTELKKRGVPVIYKLRGNDHKAKPGDDMEHNRLQRYTDLEKFFETNLQDKK
jgi:dipeptidyl aminopeptidase/acylaminoacyl peptidase